MIALIVIFELQKTPPQEAELVKRKDEAMSSAKDDPHEFASELPRKISAVRSTTNAIK